MIRNDDIALELGIEPARRAVHPRPRPARLPLHLGAKLPTLTDTFGRALIMPSGEEQGVAVTLNAPSDSTTPPTYARTFALTYDQTASDTLGGAFPGGQTSGFQGAWSDPTTGLGFHRARWMDQGNASWLSADPLGPVDSRNYYAFGAPNPLNASDPTGLFSTCIELVGEPIHEGITTDALRELGFSNFLIDAVNSGHEVADAWYQGTDAQHFDNSRFAEGIRLIEGLLSASRSERDARSAAVNFGRALHAAQDFCSHSNYVEIRTFITHRMLPSSALPLWDFVWPPTEPALQQREITSTLVAPGYNVPGFAEFGLRSRLAGEDRRSNGEGPFPG